MRRVSPIALVFVLVAVFRLSLVGRGTMAFLDETMYYKAALALDALRAGHVTRALTHVASNNARPGNAVLQLVPAAVQAIPFAFGVPPSNPQSLMIPVVFNLAVSLATLYLFWRISLVLFEGDRVASTTATAVYGLLVSSNVYVRHLLAYEPALCIGMAALWLSLSRPRTWRLAFGVGALAGCTVIVYPGYYLFAAIPCVALIATGPCSRAIERLQRAGVSVAGGVSVIVATEVLSRIGGESYIAGVRTLSRTITQGSFEEGWVFVPRYLIQVERYIGGVLLVGMILFMIRSAVELTREGRLRPIHWLVLSAIAGWIWQAAASSTAHAMVLYGRLIHPWMAFLVWATVDAIARTRPAAWRASLYGTGVAASVASWLAYAPGYVRLTYPADLLYALRIDTAVVPRDQRRCELDGSYAYESPAPLNRRTGYPYTKRTDYALINFCMGTPRPAAARPEDAVAALPLLHRGPHFMAFRAYGFEGLTAAERDEIARPQYDVRVYQFEHDRVFSVPSPPARSPRPFR